MGFQLKDDNLRCDWPGEVRKQLARRNILLQIRLDEHAAWKSFVEKIEAVIAWRINAESSGATRWYQRPCPTFIPRRETMLAGMFWYHAIKGTKQH